MTRPSLALGTVQLGVEYGVSNTTGRISAADVEALFAEARFAKIGLLDTAPGYGDAELILGSHQAGDSFRLVSKIAARLPARDIEAATERSLQRLGVRRLHGLLFHRALDLLDEEGEERWHALASLQEIGLVGRIGVSLYSPDELERLIDLPGLGIVQLPRNLLDTRFDAWLDELTRRRIEIHVRSTFLQGLLFISPADLDPFFSPIRSHLDQLHEATKGHGIGILEACLGFQRREERIDYVVVGVASSAQLAQLTTAWNSSATFSDDLWAINESPWIDPSKWELSNEE